MTRRKGDVPIPYIIALLLGVVVVALVAYWLFTGGGGFSKLVLEKTCEGKKLTYCNEYKLKDKPPSPGKFSGPCENNQAAGTYAPECCSTSLGIPMTKADCGL